MSIKFICSCGKRLRARDEMAARRSVCPRCGAPVGIPSLRPTHPETVAAPMTPAERVREQMRRIREKDNPRAEALAAVPRHYDKPPIIEEFIAAAPPGGQTAPAAPLAKRVKARSRHYCSRCRGHIEERWHECLVYPLRAILYVLGIATALAAWVISAAIFVPQILAGELGGYLGILLSLAGGCAGAAMFAYTCAFLNLTLTVTAVGQARFVISPGRNVPVVLKSALAWLVCFLVGPAVTSAIGLIFWIHSGDPAWIDWLIMVELAIVTSGYWLLCVVAVGQNDRLQDATPRRAAEALGLLGWRALSAALIATAILMGHGICLILGVLRVRHSEAVGLGMIAGACLSGTFWSVFLFRLLGVWCHLGEYNRINEPP
jgi:hypothetical protein